MKTAKEIFRDILISAQTNCVLKIKLKDSEKPMITAVEKVGKKRIVLKPTCLYGYELEKRYITLPEIETVKRYKTQFDNPLFERMRFIKNNISKVRRSFGSLNEPSTGYLNPGVDHAG